MKKFSEDVINSVRDKLVILNKSVNKKFPKGYGLTQEEKEYLASIMFTGRETEKQRLKHIIEQRKLLIQDSVDEVLNDK
jgi:hypothetical protein